MTLRTVEMALATPGVDAAGRPTRIPLGISDDDGQYREDLGAEHMLVNIGPQHPATHGVLRLVLELEGETVTPLHPSHRISPLGVREAGRVPPVQPDHSAHRPNRLSVAHGEQRLPRAGGREADGPGAD